jgi:hypothetical protein
MRGDWLAYIRGDHPTMEAGFAAAREQLKRKVEAHPTAGFQEVQSAQGGDDLLADLFALAHAVYDLEVTIGTDWLVTKKHDR